MLLNSALISLFLSTPSARRATLRLDQTIDQQADFYPRPPRGGRHYMGIPTKVSKGISIHALREEGDDFA